jgi:hypothetical protein
VKVSETSSASVTPTTSSVQGQLENYLAELQQMPQDKDALTFLCRQHASYSQISELAEDLVAAPASQA